MDWRMDVPKALNFVKNVADFMHINGNRTTAR